MCDVVISDKYIKMYHYDMTLMRLTDAADPINDQLNINWLAVVSEKFSTCIF